MKLEFEITAPTLEETQIAPPLEDQSVALAGVKLLPSKVELSTINLAPLK